MADGSVEFHKKTIYTFALATTFLWPVSAFPQGVGETTVLDEVLIEGDKIGRTFDEIVPSIVVFTEEDLERPDLPTVFSVINSSPNVIADEDGTLPTVRGISSTVNTNQVLGSGVLPRVPILVDNVATGAAQSSGLLSNTAWDVSTVEVAKGPQATSTGQNAFSGAIRIFTNDPVFEPEYKFRVGGQTFRNEFNGAFVANQPFFDDQVAIRVAGQIRDSDTVVFVDDPLVTALDPNELRFQDIRSKIRYVPDQAPELDLQFTYEVNDTRDHFAPIVEPAVLDPFLGTVITPANGPDERFINSFQTNSAIDLTLRQRFIGEGSYEFNDRTKLFLRASRSTTDLENPFLGTPLPGFRPFGSLLFDEVENEFEAYLQFGFSDIITKGVIGVLHTRSDETVDTDPSPVAALDPFLIDVVGDAVTTGVYGEVEVNVGKPINLDGLTLIAGARVEFDERSRSVFADTFLQSSATFEETAFLPKVGLKYEFDQGTEIGYTYSTAFRPAGLEVDLVSGFLFPVGSSGFLGIAEFEREDLTNHEAYIKTSVLDDQLKLSATGFFYNYEDAQVVGASPTPSAFAAFGFALTGNVPEARGLGLELAADFIHDSGFSASGSIGLLDTEITDAGDFLPTVAGVNLDSLPNTAEFSANFGVNYAHDAGWNVGVNVRHVGDIQSLPNSTVLPSYTVVDLRGGYEFDGPKGTNFRLDAAVSNLFGADFFVENTETPIGPGQQTAARDRSFAIQLTGKF